ncbi:MAG: sigma 54-interacting transcriptional regulator [Proteobacteria bacterium]|nr:sigma 54-interacting transcriptional regulator [Pseudomonadota bacterium]
MATLRVILPDGASTVHPLHRNVTSVGRAAACDVVVGDPALAETHCHLRCDGRAYEISAIGKSELWVAGKRRSHHELRHGDRLRIGGSELVFGLHDEPSPPPSGDSGALYRRFFEFSSRLLRQYELPELLDALLDAVIAVTHAQRAFLVLLDGEVPRISVARNVEQESIDDALDQLSDSIIARVVRTRQPLLVSDVQQDAELGAARSVLRLQLASVLCVPLVDQDTLLGLIYLGNNSVLQGFDRTTLDLLNGFAAHASLIVKNALLINSLQLDRQQLKQRLDALRFGRVIGACDAMRDMFRRVEKVAPTDISVLITGETGTGKELIALELHERSPRRRGPFVSINCGAIPEHLIESELFGHAKGAFTGAVAHRRGKFHAADGGTLFLDEIGELPLALQVKLLRVLQDKAVVRVGETRPEPVDIRVVAATNRNLQQEVAAGAFREDLYYRINVINLHLPPLRERGDDVTLIAKYLLDRYADELGSKVRGLSADAAVAVRRYGWPGNIRQLENHLKRAVVLSDKPLLSALDLDLKPEDLPPVVPLAQAKEDYARQYVAEVLARNGGNRTQTARQLDVDPRTIFRYLEKGDEAEDGAS